ncbi:MAG: DNA mismatch repair protein MutS [Verrucomicrobia bacterium]|nr:DNA mismatch repair protein MutS [Verrucomicrobiota bacterium]
MAESLTPMMQQYQRIKREIPTDALLLFRLGDFYEMFFEDAKGAAQLLNLTLTQRNGIPMCGIPHHASENYIARLIRAGRKVAVCDQLEEAGESKGIIKRDVTQILSPGTVMSERYLTANRNNFIAAVCAGGTAARSANDGFGLALLDISTGEFRLTELPDEKSLSAELKRVAPVEIVIPGENPALSNSLSDHNLKISAHEAWVFEYETAFFTLRDHFKTQSLDGFGCQEMHLAVMAAGGLFHYLQQHLRRSLNHVHRLHVYAPGDFMLLDQSTRHNLELLDSRHSSEQPASLVWALDRTVTAMGGRLLREWVSHPLRKLAEITARHEVVAELIAEGAPLTELREKLREVRDLERIIGRLSTAGGNARDMIGLKMSLHSLPALRQITGSLHSPLAAAQHALIGEFPELAALIARAVVEDPPLALKEGGLIQPGFDSTLDDLRTAMRSGKEWIAQLQQQEIERTGIKSLKVRFNSVFGYYIEITKSNLQQAPAHYIRKQTVATGERFITPELKEMEDKILGAEERAMKLEYEIFQRVREEAARLSASIQETARAIGVLDVLAGFAEGARHHNYARPQMDEAGLIDIVDGRHPVLEQVMQTDPNHVGKGGFVPNDTRLDSEQNQVLLITGPNMAGKSTYIRQVALLVLMAQVGSFVPARSARIGLVDRIFTRVGAMDDLARGQSTFMVEMNETANILNNATAQSLVILDEIGRGTSTYDGISIAWAVAEYLHERIRAKTLFATHYHELTAMSRRFPRVKNFNVAVREWNDQIIFLRKIQPGGADKSYGIQVARLAGLPGDVLHRAKEMLNHLEAVDLLEQPSESAPWTTVDSAAKPAVQGASKTSRRKKNTKPTSQMLLFAAAQARSETAT